ncbi:hypothetical protein BB561_000770 [Smittium simulii]|uniref:tRNA(Ile)-lysidine synthetase n=1 Tax=Smittium simulii TaxID=133385 RepID=A0A2T9YXP6_9FUNG|nr:hypothetical protein BB561_000770 [Smittium simulii]
MSIIHSNVAVLSKFNSILKLYDTPKLKYGLAISGGIDSMALAYLSKNSTISERCIPIIIDHSLRKESFYDAEKACEFLRILGYFPQIIKLKWAHDFIECSVNIFDKERLVVENTLDSLRNSYKYTYYSSFKKPPVGPKLEEVARAERYKAIESLCKKQAISYLMTGHHRNDLCETFLMRLSRQSGLFGLSGTRVLDEYPIISSSFSKSLKVFRPLLFDFTKEDLLKICTGNNLNWVEDPSNTNTIFKRNSIRKTISDTEATDNFYGRALYSVNITPVVSLLQNQQKIIEKTVNSILSNIANFNYITGECTWDNSEYISLSSLFNSDTLLHLCLSKTIKWVSCSIYPPELKDIKKIAGYIKSSYASSSSNISVSGILLYKPTKKDNFWVFSKHIPSSAILNTLDHIGSLPGKEILWNDTTFISVDKKSPYINIKYSVISIARALYCHSVYRINFFDSPNQNITFDINNPCFINKITLNQKELIKFYKIQAQSKLFQQSQIIKDSSLLYQPIIISYTTCSNNRLCNFVHSFIPFLQLSMGDASKVQISFKRKF